jgi:hypothetical protein
MAFLFEHGLYVIEQETYPVSNVADSALDRTRKCWYNIFY